MDAGITGRKVTTLGLRDEKILALANHIGRKKGKASYDFDSPEYLILEPITSHELCDIMMTFEILEKVTAEEVAKRMGRDDVEHIHDVMIAAADIGHLVVNTVDGEDVFWFEPWIPGIMEILVNHPTLPYKYPQIAEAFEAYGRVRGSATTGMTPVGVGLMRVIPIEKAIDASTHRASFEEISKHIEENDRFSVSNCACRTAREIMGEGCGHLKEDMCIQLGWAAEYYIRTGRGREVTKDEVYEILRKAEENGLMHEVPNLDGNGKTHAICNCCGCGCLSMRSGEMFKNVDLIRSNYVSVVDPEKCVACGECVENCPMNAMKLGQKLCSTSAVTQDITTTYTPRDHEWKEENWNPEYRFNREYTVDTGTAPCKTNCPAHIAVQGYIKLASQGRYPEALELIKKENPLPAICGRICNRRCEDACTRGSIDSPLAIDEIKKFIAEKDLHAETRFVPRKRHDYSDKKIAIIGAGPAGLSAAYYLAIDGYDITVFEKEQRLGGILTLGIPEFRLEKDIVDAEIDIIREMGVKFLTGVEIGRDMTIQDLRNSGFKAIYIAIGAQGARRLGVDNEDSEGIFSAVSFMKECNLGKRPDMGDGNVVVIGGGNVAIDASRSALRLTGRTVYQVSLESYEEMPAAKDEIEEAKEEGVVFHPGWGVKEIEAENGHVKAVVLRRCVSVFDENHRFSPEYDDEETMRLECSSLLSAIGQKIDYRALLEGEDVELNRNGTIKVDPVSFQTTALDIFAGGDVVTGPAFAIDAIAEGKQAAITMHRFVQPGQDLVAGRIRREFNTLNKDTIVLDNFDRTPRQTPFEKLDRTSFKDQRKVFTEEQMKAETRRCLGCGATVVDEFMCVGCGQCTTKCHFDAVHLERRYDGEGVHLNEMKKVIIPHVIKRKGRIAIRSIKDRFGAR